MSDYKNYFKRDNPIDNFNDWYDEASKTEDNPAAFILSTYSKEDGPNGRTLLFKGIFESKFLFFTNYISMKSQEIEHENRVALTFFWNKLGRQVRIRGTAEKASFELSKNYFHSRSFEDQVASYISKQSLVVESREKLLEIFEEEKEKYKDGKVPYPDNWGGYLIDPCEIMFFIYQDFRLNDRFQFKKEDGKWKDLRLFP